MWDFILNFTEITYTQTKYIMRKFTRIRRLSIFFLDENENPCADIAEEPCKINRKKCCVFVLRHKNPKAQYKRNQKLTFTTCFHHVGGDIKAAYVKVQSYYS